ncbi:hypothetical protein FKR81_32305 [Lentzea tibetensis]|uniref:Aminoglycoside phosphotransferase n=1 Tax=Lentzea tibetensis TaxID=2591470 RepID=A0A563EKA1_9PSEU|nr:hypothetical protein FKR81_32305 [Lentzea tibetensis]
MDESRSAYGTQGSTIGFATSSDTWVRIAWTDAHDIHGPSWTGTEIASAITGVKKPELFRSYRWVDRVRSVVWRADETELITSRAIHSTGLINEEPDLSVAWWDSLGSSLAALAAVETERVAMAQAHLTRRINQVFGDEGIDTEVDEWTTAHADLHFGNLTAPDCYLLDWDSWGRAPRGLDAATLWGHCLLVPSVAHRVQAEFVDDLSSRSGLLAQLLFCSNVIRLNSSKPKPSPLLEPVKKEAVRVLHALGANA